MEKILYSSVFCVPQKKKVIQVWIDVRVSKWWQFPFLNLGKKNFLPLTPFHQKKLSVYQPILSMKYVAFASVFLKTMWMVLGEQSSSETCYCFLASSGATSCSTTTSAAATATECWEVPQELRKRGRRTGRAVPSSTHSTHIHLQRTMLFTLLHKRTCLCCFQPIIKRWGNQGVFYYYTLLRWKIPSSILLCV